MSIFVIGDRHTLLGFGLVGVAGKEAADGGEARRILDELLSQDDVDLILVTEDLAAQMREKMDYLRLNLLHPVVVEIPASGSEQQPRSLRDLVQKIVGIRLGT